MAALWRCPFRRRRRSQISSSRHPFVKRIGVIYLLSTRISFLLTFCMVSHFSLFYSYHNHQNHEKRPPWRKNLPPHFSTATSLPNTQCEYVNARILYKEDKYSTHSEKGVSLICFLSLTNIQNSCPWRHLSPPLTHLQLYSFFLLTHEINRYLPCPDYMNRFQEKRVSFAIL